MSLKRKHEPDFLETNTHCKKFKISHTETLCAVIYCRVRTLDQYYSSCDYQADSCIEFCRQNNYNIIKIIKEISPGKNLSSQPQLKELLKNKKNITVIVSCVDRFSRNVTHCINMFEIMKKNNINLISVTDNIDLRTDYGQHAFKIRVSNAQLESALISERVTRSIKLKKASELKSSLLRMI